MMEEYVPTVFWCEYHKFMHPVDAYVAENKCEQIISWWHNVDDS